MKPTLPLLAFVFASLSGSVAFAAGKSYLVEIQGMDCDGCSEGIAKSIKELPGIEQVEVSFKKKQASLTLKEGQAIDEAAISGAVKKAGFKTGKIKPTS